MDCPRCRMPLVHDRYEGVPVHICKECWGYWLDRGEFAKITMSRQYSFSDEERRRIMTVAAVKGRTAKKEDDPDIACPRCGQSMQKVHFNVKAPITLDRCEAHGVWLDTYELKLAQVLAEDVAAVRQLFFQKLKE